ncbi:MAG: hypothetical protein AAGA48_06870 [Myxococcota bacterium]
MARVLRHLVDLRLPVLISRKLRWLLIGGLAGCGAPITNAPFMEEPRFLEALLAREDVVPPAALGAVVPTDATAPLLATTLGSVSAYADFLSFPVEICAQLREVGANRRTAQRRTWTPTALTVPVAEGPSGGQRLETMWVQADVVQLGEDIFEVRIDVAETEAGPFQTIGTSRSDADGSAWRWELDGVVDVLDLAIEGRLQTLEFSVVQDPEVGRRVEARYGTAPTFDGYWFLEGPDQFAFNGRFAVTTDDFTWPGQLGTIHTAEGGFAGGEIDIAGERLAFGSCWSADGTGIWQGGTDPRIASAGDPEACPFTGSSR